MSCYPMESITQVSTQELMEMLAILGKHNDQKMPKIWETLIILNVCHIHHYPSLSIIIHHYPSSSIIIYPHPQLRLIWTCVFNSFSTARPSVFNIFCCWRSAEDPLLRLRCLSCWLERLEQLEHGQPFHPSEWSTSSKQQHTFSDNNKGWLNMIEYDWMSYGSIWIPENMFSRLQ